LAYYPSSPKSKVASTAVLVALRWTRLVLLLVVVVVMVLLVVVLVVVVVMLLVVVVVGLLD
jgi:hypothetical protein